MKKSEANFSWGTIYRARPDVNSISHTHSPMVTILGIAGQTVRPLHNTGVVFHSGVPLFMRPGLIDTDELGDQVAATLGQHRAVMLRGHGATIVAPSLKLATVWSLILEEAARNQVWASAIGKPLFFTEAEMDLVSRHFLERAGDESQIERAWNYYASRIEPF